jgi:RNA polymerase sigma-70 factor (ECF subfamily)
MDDVHILKLLWERSDAALSALQQRFGTRLYCTAYNILGNQSDAEEAVNDALLAIWNAIPPEKPQPLEGYVYRTGRNIALKKLRFQSAQKRSSQYDLSLDELAGALPDNSMQETLDARALGQAIDCFLSSLSEENRALFLRRYWFGDSLKDITKAFGLTENTATVRLSRLRKQLKDYLYKEGFFDGP